MFFEADLHLQLHIISETLRRSLHHLKLSADVQIETQLKCNGWAKESSDVGM